MKIRVLHVVLSLETGGLENGIINLANHSDRNNFIVDILCLRDKGELAERIVNPDSRVHFDGNQSHSIKSAIKKVYRVCKENQYHIIHSHGFTTMLAAYVGGKLAGNSTIMNGEHGTIYHSSTKKKLAQQFLFKRMAINLTVSENLKQKLLTAFNIRDDNFKAIINGVDTEKFCLHDDNKAIRSKIEIPHSDIVIGSVGRLVPVKNYPSLIRAFHKIIQKHNNIHLVLAGDGTELDVLVNQINELKIQKHVHLLGRRDDIPSIMNLIDVFVLPSFSEGLSNTLLEAMSCGKPVVASDVGGNSEIVVPGITGFLYPSDNSNQLAKILGNLINSQQLIKQMSVQSRLHIENNYSVNSMVRNYETTYIDLMNKNNFKLNFATQKQK